jgi:adenylosuccinate lyase
LYDNPLITRYASREMSALWSAQKKHSTWRRLWVALAEAERELGLDISAEQVESLRAAVDDIDFAAADTYERRLRHDVMAHVHAFGDRCPNARGIIHLGATSCFVTDNTDLILMREALKLIGGRLVTAIDRLARFAAAYRDLPCLGFTHLQPAQPTTVGKRATLWCYDLVLDLEELEHRLDSLRFRGVKGTTGTQASFLTLFDGDHAKVRELDRRVARAMGFGELYAVTGQTYSRKVDSQVVNVLSGSAESASKAGNDLRLLQSRKEVEEPFGSSQIGSSAMAYKRNPMQAERMCSLSRFLMSLTANTAQTTATQWLERTLDDSANRRLVIPQAFLTADAILILYGNIIDGLVVYPNVIARHLQEELPFMATEEILMAGVRAGGDRQDLHERIRFHSQDAARQVKEHGQPNDLLDRLQRDPALAHVDFSATLDARRYTGRAAEQVDEFLTEIAAPIQAKHRDKLTDRPEVIQL